jgi:putative acetyltransferase
MIQILRATEPSQINHTRVLFVEYARTLEVDLCFQSFEKELAELPGGYAPPCGCLLLALDGDRPAGCVALRDLGSGIAEMKRLYVRPEYRGQHLGRALVERIIGEARRVGYEKMRLDTLPSMKAAINMYRSLGFQPIPAYWSYPIEGLLFMELPLDQGA